MKYKSISNQENNFTIDTVHNEQGYPSLKLSKNDFELYDNEKSLPASLYRVKRTSTAGKGERWRLMRDDELLFVLEGKTLSKKEKEFLRTVEGVSFLTSQIKMNIPTLSKLRTAIKIEVKKRTNAAKNTKSLTR